MTIQYVIGVVIIVGLIAFVIFCIHEQHKRDKEWEAMPEKEKLLLNYQISQLQDNPIKTMRSGAFAAIKDLLLP